MLRPADFELAGRVAEPDGEGFAGGSACGDRVRITLSLGAGGEIKLGGRAAAEQRLRLRMEGVTFAGKRIDLTQHQHVFE